MTAAECAEFTRGRQNASQAAYIQLELCIYLNKIKMNKTEIKTTENLSKSKLSFLMQTKLKGCRELFQGSIVDCLNWHPNSPIITRVDPRFSYNYAFQNKNVKEKEEKACVR